MNNKTNTLLSALLMGTALMGTAQAEQSNWYTGVSLGATNVDTGISGTTGTAVLDEAGNGFKLAIGKKLDKTIAIEGFYADFGSGSLTGNTGDTFVANNTTWVFTTNNANVTQAVTGLGVNAKFTHDFTSKSSIAGRLGLLNWSTSMTVSGASIPTSSLSKNGTDIFYGLGYKYQLNSQYALTADYDSYMVDSSQMTMLAIGMQYDF